MAIELSNPRSALSICSLRSTLKGCLSEAIKGSKPPEDVWFTIKGKVAAVGQHAEGEAGKYE